MDRVTLIGVDPGVVDTGAVAIYLDASVMTIQVEFSRLPGSDAAIVKDFIDGVLLAAPSVTPAAVFVEAYRDRGTVFGQHSVMRALEHEIKQRVPAARILDNTGVKKIITPGLMQLFDVWTFNVPTHHQDLRSAARIALYGGVKNDDINQLLTKYVVDKLRLKPKQTFTTTEKEASNG